MVETSVNPSLLDRIRSKAHVSKPDLADRRSASPVIDTSATRIAGTAATTSTDHVDPHTTSNHTSNPFRNNVTEKVSAVLPPPAPLPQAQDANGETSPTIDAEGLPPNLATRFYYTTKEILLASYINILLVFVPTGIAVNFAGVNPTIVFALNAIAIVPLASLLSYATESVASSMGDTVGALMNVTFGNAVELIIFMYVKLTVIKTIESPRLPMKHRQLDCVPYYLPLIALVKNEIRIVQASLLGSILANLLLILGMCFLFGGLRFREQIYNSTVTQMSACLLSLSVMSLLLPTAFHASFTDTNLADVAVLRVSRGTSIILLLVYVLYLLFQLKSHAYMYESTPQHVIDEESHPGLLADMLGSSSSSDTSSSSENDSDGSSGSNTTAKRFRRAFRGRKRRKSSASSKEVSSLPSAVRTPSEGNVIESFSIQSPRSTLGTHALGAITSGDEADTDGEHEVYEFRNRDHATTSRDFENEKASQGVKTPEIKPNKKSKKRHRNTHVRYDRQSDLNNQTSPIDASKLERPVTPASQHVSFVPEAQIVPETMTKKPFNLRGLSVRPTMPKMLTTTVFSAANPTGIAPLGPPAPVAVPRAPYGLRRASSLPDRLNKTQTANQMTRPQINTILVNASSVPLRSEDSQKTKKHISRSTAIVLLLISTALVAVCAEFLVSSINYLVNNTSVSEAFIGLIVLPIVGNAAEHVTAVTVASKNKMDLAIGVAVGSSIQIALFVTPVVVLLGWALSKDMTLYFSLFETVSLFVSAFIVNFLVLDGRSNYLEGALLIAAYIIIAVAAFFYPSAAQQSTIGGAQEAVVRLL
ncbi:MAG: hypothetical protein MMC33_000006 [Icmadophila ericetorum]|nr:hypothetical protein [Icmadophila ericetorum]